MNKLVYGVGVNDLGYRTQVEEKVTENGGKRIRKHVFRCKYYATWTRMLKRCYTRRQYVPVNGWLVERKWFDEEKV